MSSIAVFDSGIGGLTVLKEIKKLLPDENYIYYGDGKACPFGSLSASKILEVTTHAVDFFVSRGVKLIVIACNTATAVAVKELRSRYSIPIVAMEPAIKPALARSKSKVVGVLATKCTIEGEPLRALCSRVVSDQRVVLTAGVGLVEIVEKEQEFTADDYAIVERYIEEMASEGVDQIVLGCTHYPFLINVMKKIIAGRDISIIDPAPRVALRVKELLIEGGMLNDCGSGTIEFASSLDGAYNDFIKNNYHKLLSL